MDGNGGGRRAREGGWGGKSGGGRKEDGMRDLDDNETCRFTPDAIE